MFGFIKSLFGGSDTAKKSLDIVDSAIKGVGNWIDEKDFTEEEKAKSLAAAVNAHLELVKAINNENSTRSVTRRWLAWGITGYVLLWGSIAMVFAIVGKNDIVNGMIDIVNSLNIGVAFTAVVGLYFGVQFLRK